VVGHEAESEDVNLGPLFGLDHELHEGLIVAGLAEDSQPAVAAVEYVMHQPAAGRSIEEKVDVTFSAREKGESTADERRFTRIEKTHIFRPQSAFIRVYLRLSLSGVEILRPVAAGLRTRRCCGRFRVASLAYSYSTFFRRVA
jgi:hypothetical protein